MAEWRKAHQIDELVNSFRFAERAIVRGLYPHYYHKVRMAVAFEWLMVALFTPHGSYGSSCSV